MLQITIPEPLPSLNKFYQSPHWAVRKHIADYWHKLVKDELLAQNIKHSTISLTTPVVLFITCYFNKKGRILDADNICGKVAIDPLTKACEERQLKRLGIKTKSTSNFWLIEDDSLEYVSAVIYRPIFKKIEEPRTEIRIFSRGEFNKLNH